MRASTWIAVGAICICCTNSLTSSAVSAQFLQICLATKAVKRALRCSPEQSSCRAHFSAAAKAADGPMLLASGGRGLEECWLCEWLGMLLAGMSPDIEL